MPLGRPPATRVAEATRWPALRFWFLSAMGVFTDGFDLYMVAGACLLGRIVTRVFGIETRGRPLDGAAPPAAA